MTVSTDWPNVPGGALRIVTSERGTATTIFLQGELDLAGEHATREAVASALQRPPECLVLDLSGLSFIDSSGVHIAIELARRSAAQNFRLVIVPGPRAVQRIFEICHLTEILPFVTPPSFAGTRFAVRGSGDPGSP